MISAPIQPLPPMDRSWPRMAWIVPLAFLTWTAMLVGFSVVLEQTRPMPEPAVQPIEARLVELPPPVVGGLQGGGAPAPPAPKPRVAPKPQPIAHPKKIRVKKVKVAPPPPVPHPALPEETAALHPPAPAEGPSGGYTKGESTGARGSSKGGGLPGGEGGGGGGIRNDSLGARALYSPLPTIPDDLREEVFQAVAVARFKVTRDGAAQVALVKPTTNSELNELLLSTLKQWRFQPAVKDGVPIDSVFELRIPITVQ